MYLQKTESLEKTYPHLRLVHVDGAGIGTLCAAADIDNCYGSAHCVSSGSPVFYMRQGLEATAPTVTGIEGMGVRSCQECQVYLNMEQKTEQAKAVFDSFSKTIY
ncbi:hypothetical protein KKD37_04580 [Patescibacteria group bacterium]|nr:hypothetical protein [Patescibacteria group bacterium]